MYRITSDEVDVEDLRSRLRKMTDAELLAFGKSARYVWNVRWRIRKPPLDP
jgi:hypothetical protein